MITDINTDTEIAIPISLNNCPIGKSRSKIGINTTTVVSAEPSIGAQTWRDPLYAAVIGAIPDCFNLNIFSWLTIDASTTIPTAKANPANEMTFTDRPNQEIATNVPITETGMANIIINVGRKLLKKSISIQIAKIPPIIIFCWTNLIAAFI